MWNYTRWSDVGNPFRQLIQFIFSPFSIILARLDEYKDSDLYRACAAGDTCAARALIECDADVTYAWNRGAETALHAAARAVRAALRRWIWGMKNEIKEEKEREKGWTRIKKEKGNAEGTDAIWSIVEVLSLLFLTHLLLFITACHLPPPHARRGWPILSLCYLNVAVILPYAMRGARRHIQSPRCSLYSLSSFSPSTSMSRFTFVFMTLTFSRA